MIIVDRQRRCVSQSNPAAVKAGIVPGMDPGTAASLCQQLQIVDYQAEIEEQRLLRIAHALYQHTADIALFPPNGLALRVTPMLRLYDGLDDFWQSINHQLQQRQLNYHFGCGFTPLAARILARNGLDQLCDDRHGVLAQLHACPLASIDTPPNNIDKLQRLGLHTLGDILKIPFAEFNRRFDRQITTYLGRLTARFKHPLEFYRPPHRFSRYLELFYEIRQNDRLHKVLTPLFSALEAFLTRRDHLAMSVMLSLYQRHAPAQKIHIASPVGEYRASHWLTLSTLTLSRIKLASPVYAIELTASQMHPNQGSQHDLFDGCRAAPSTVELLSVLTAKLGTEAVLGVSLTDDNRPELASLHCPPRLKDDQPNPQAIINDNNQGKAQTNSQSKRPVVDHSPAVRLRPSFLCSQPQRLSSDRQQQLMLVQGPERIKSGWWDQHPVQRDYYIARDQQGQWLWLFTTPHKGWFIHGYFS